MLRLLSFVRAFHSRRLSAMMLALATAALLLWIQVHAALAALTDDGTILRSSLAVADDRAVREQLGGLITAGGELIGSPPVLAEVTGAILSDAPLSGPMTEALAETYLITRDRVMAQFGAGAHTPVSVPVGPLMAALGIDFTADDLAALQAGVPLPSEQDVAQAAEGLEGVSVPGFEGFDISELFGDAAGGIAALGTVTFGEHGLEIPLVSAVQVEHLETAYTWGTRIDRWGLVVAAVAAVIGVASARRPWRSLAILFGLVAGAAAAAPLVFGWVSGLLSTGALGAWALLIAPVLSATQTQVGAWLTPAAVGAGVLAVAFLALHLLRGRRPARR